MSLFLYFPISRLPYFPLPRDPAEMSRRQMKGIADSMLYRDKSMKKTVKNMVRRLLTQIKHFFSFSYFSFPFSLFSILLIRFCVYFSFICFRGVIWFVQFLYLFNDLLILFYLILLYFILFYYTKMDETVKKLDGMVGGRQRLNSAVSRKQLSALTDSILEQQEQRERDLKAAVENMVRGG